MEENNTAGAVYTVAGIMTSKLNVTYMFKKWKRLNNEISLHYNASMYCDWFENYGWLVSVAGRIYVALVLVIFFYCIRYPVRNSVRWLLLTKLNAYTKNERKGAFLMDFKVLLLSLLLLALLLALLHWPQTKLSSHINCHEWWNGESRSSA